MISNLLNTRHHITGNVFSCSETAANFLPRDISARSLTKQNLLNFEFL